MDIISKYLPEKVKTALADKDVARDLDILLLEVEKALGTAAQNPALDSKLRTAFNDAVAVLDIADTYVTKGKLSFFTLAKIAANKGRYEKAGETLAEAFNSNDPALAGIVKSLQDNPRAQGAFKRIALKTNGDLFRLEQRPDGLCYGIELVTGSNMQIPLDPKVYADIKAILDAPPSAPPPAPPRPPRGPSA